VHIFAHDCLEATANRLIVPSNGPTQGLSNES